MNVIREYYVKTLQSQIPDISIVFRTPREYGLPSTYAFLLFSVFVILDSLCFAGAAFVLTEFRLSIDNGSALSFPFVSRPSIIAAFICFLVLILHILFYTFTL